MNDATGDVAEVDRKHEILLPPDKGEGEYVLECWKVKEGTLVRAGETVALACLAKDKKDVRNDTSESSNAAQLPSKPVHKRPARRKRTAVAPVAPSASIPSGPKGSGDLKSITLFPTEKGKKPNSTSHTTGNSTTTTANADASAKKQPQSIPIVAPTTGFVRITNMAEESSATAIGFIELCKHPFVVDGLCGVCGMSIKGTAETTIAVPSASSSVEDSNASKPIPTTQVTVSGGLTFTVSEQESVQIGKQNTQRLKQLKKLSLVLDLDHTLVHATADTRASEHLDERDDVRSLVLSVSEDAPPGNNMWMQHFVKLRPNVKEFLEAVMPMYEVGVYTAGTRQYAEQIATVLCRHLVGAKHDQVHLDRLRYEVPRAEAQLKWQEQNQKSPVEDKTESTQQDDEEDEEQNGNEGGPPSKKRKVMFTAGTKEGKESSTQGKSEEINTAATQEKVAKLKNELALAERLEREATEMRKRVFGSRIVSRSDVGDLGRDVKSLKRIFPCGGTMAAVVDDREDVWANAKDNNTNPSDKASSRRGEPPENLLLVKPYHWQPFVGFADINNASGVDLSEKYDDQSATKKTATESDVQLLWTADVLKRLHARYYDQDNSETTTVPEILQEMRKEVLQGFKIVLSGLVPLHRQGQDDKTASPRPPVVRYAESLGASLLPTVQSDTAFVIAARDGTDKILQARKIPGCSVVKISWLMECFWTMTQRDPRQHLLSPAGRDKSKDMSNGNASMATEIAKDSDDDDDDFAAEFEEDFL